MTKSDDRQPIKAIVAGVTSFVVVIFLFVIFHIFHNKDD